MTGKTRILFLMVMPLLMIGPATEATLIRADLEGVRFEQKLGNILPGSVLLTDENGEHRLVSEFFGKTPILLVFTYFRCPNLCTLVLNGLVQSLRMLPDQL